MEKKMAKKPSGRQTGKIAQVIGAVVDVAFEGDLPFILDALQVNNDGQKLILEVKVNVILFTITSEEKNIIKNS